MKHIVSYWCILFLFTACGAARKEKDNAGKSTQTSAEYTLSPVRQAGVSSTIKLPAQLAAYQEVSIFPKVNAYVKTVLVDIGDRVKKGAILMKLEAPELQQAVVQAREKYARALADLSIDREHYHRMMEAAATPGAISALDISTIRSKMESDSALSNSEKSNWQMQSELQTYLTVLAPFDGVITERNAYPGALVNSIGKDRPMLELKDIARLRLRADIPEALAATLQTNDTISFYTSALPGRKMTGKISRKSMNVDPKYRSEKIEIDVDNKQSLLSPGMYADVVVYSNGARSAVSVPSSAIVANTERKFVWVSDQGKARSVDVTTGSAFNGMTEIFGNIDTLNQVISNPDDDLAEGRLIK